MDFEKILEKEIRFAVSRLIEDNKDHIFKIIENALMGPKLKEIVDAEIERRKYQEDETKEFKKTGQEYTNNK